MSYGCIKEACEFRDAMATKEVFKRTDCDVIGITSNPQERLKAFVDQYGIGYPVLCDANGEARKLYSVGKGLAGLTEGD